MLQMLECFKSTGMSIQEMKQFSKWVQQGDDSLEQRYEMFLERRKTVIFKLPLNFIDRLKMRYIRCRKHFRIAAVNSDKQHIKQHRKP